MIDIQPEAAHGRWWGAPPAPSPPRRSTASLRRGADEPLPIEGPADDRPPNPLAVATLALGGVSLGLALLLLLGATSQAPEGGGAARVVVVAWWASALLTLLLAPLAVVCGLRSSGRGLAAALAGVGLAALPWAALVAFFFYLTLLFAAAG